VARNCAAASRVSFTASHQQPSSGAPQVNISPHAPHFFCVEAHQSRCVSCLLEATRLPVGVMGMRLGKVALENLYNLFFGDGADDLIGHLPAFED
jgi:hypothetical protein